jgi:tRNA-2-methylthio-N6-dimethylallyladenosine synthase
VAECAALAEVGVREVTLIGQNVNSYRGGCDFAALLRRVAAIPGLARIRFTTSHPHDLSDRLVAAYRDEPKVMAHFHLPVQSGSDPVLARMRRGYTVDGYLERHDALAAARPGVAITTDFIVGFPGETEDDFEASLTLLRRARFENSFSFVFSPRAHTAAQRRLGSGPGWDPVPRQVALRRLERLLAVQRAITAEGMQAALGREVEVLIEGSGEDGGLRQGRSPENRMVHVLATEAEAPTGALVRVKVVRAGRASLGGELMGRAAGVA